MFLRWAVEWYLRYIAAPLCLSTDLSFLFEDGSMSLGACGIRRWLGWHVPYPWESWQAPLCCHIDNGLVTVMLCPLISSLDANNLVLINASESNAWSCQSVWLRISGPSVRVAGHDRNKEKWFWQGSGSNVQFLLDFLSALQMSHGMPKLCCS